MNVAIITIDSLRYDVALDAKTPNLNKIFKSHQTKWHKCYAPGVYTLPSHLSILHAGIFPTNLLLKKDVYNRFQKNAYRMNKESVYNLNPDENCVKAFEHKGYGTIGVGGVDWFNIHRMSCKFWKNYFQVFFWRSDFSHLDFNSFENQILFLKSFKFVSPYFFFLNISSTHWPYRTKGSDVVVKRLENQVKAFEYVDSHILALFELLPKPVHVFLMSDHGECFGEQGMYGHGFYHKNIMRVPMTHFIMR